MFFGPILMTNECCQMEKHSHERKKIPPIVQQVLDFDRFCRL